MATSLVRPSATVAVGEVDVEVSSGRVALDSGRVPYGQATVEVPLIDLEDLEALDPRDDLRVALTASDDVAGLDRVFDLGLRARAVDHKRKLITLELASDEAILMDYAPLVADLGARAHEASLRAVCDYVLGKIGAELEAGDWDADVTAYWPVTNLISNPSFAVDTSGWAPNAGGTALSRQASPVAFGSGVLRVVAAIATANADLESAVTARAGTSYVLSAYVTSGPVSRDAQVLLRFYGAVGQIIQNSFSATVATPTSGWTRLHVIATAPPGAARMTVHLITQGNASGNAHYWDGVMLHEGGELVPFFDGATTGGGYTYAWAGDADASASTRTPDVQRPPELFVWDAGVTAWEFLEPLTSPAGLRLFCDEQRVWRLVDPAEYSVPGVVSIARWNATEGTDTITRDDPNVYCTGVVVRYTWTDATGTKREATDSAGTTGRVLVWEYERPYPGPGAAAAILARRTGTGRVQNVTALANWTTTPGAEASISLPGTLDQIGRVAAVSWDLKNGLMDLGTAGLIDALPGSWIAWDPDEVWDDVDDALVWDEVED